mgnify:FL=1|tara:strand:- start:185 stop:361 length:177 start_codon:yes stop_codon:yes gene_type:complete
MTTDPVLEKLTKQEIDDLISLVKSKIKLNEVYEHDITSQKDYDLIWGKLVLMRETTNE